MVVFLLTYAEESVIHILLNALQSMVTEEVLGFENNMTKVTDISRTQPGMFPLKVQSHVVRFVGQMLAQSAAKPPIFCAICVQLH